MLLSVHLTAPVEIQGLDEVPNAGEIMMAVADEKEARNIAEAFIAQSKEQKISETKARLSLDGLFSQIEAGNVKELNLIIKADVMGSVEAVKQSLVKLSNEEVVVRVIHGGVGNINESDVNLAGASNAIIIGFNVKPDTQAADKAEQENVDVRCYDVIYKAIEDIGFSSKETLAGDVSVTETSYFINKDGVLVVDATITGTKHDALMEMYLNNEGLPTDVGVTVNKTTGEKLENAGLNTLLGMGMAFAVLIIISLIISLFPLISGTGRKKKESDKEIAQKAMDNTITQIADKEDLSSDAELVAVIAAAIAAYEGSASTDGFTVRSIRRVNSKWKNNR